MSFQSRDWRLKLLVAALMIVGTSPGLFAQEYISCFGCNGGPNCDNPSRDGQKRICGARDNAACFKTGVAGAMERGCYSEWGSICIEREFLGVPDAYGSRCYNALVHKEKTKEIEKCIADHHKNKEKPELPTDPETTLCVCSSPDTPYCNGGPAEVVYEPTEATTTRPIPTRKPKVNSAGQSASINARLIFCFLTISTAYKYTGRITSF